MLKGLRQLCHKQSVEARTSGVGGRLSTGTPTSVRTLLCNLHIYTSKHLHIDIHSCNVRHDVHHCNAIDLITKTNKIKHETLQLQVAELWIVSEFCRGGSLGAAARRGDFLSPTSRTLCVGPVLRVLRDIAAGMGYLHARQVRV